MDLITQGVTGALLAQSSAKKEQVRSASLAGFFAGLLPDADILIRSANDPLLNLEFHRQFSHALVFIPLGGLVACLLLWPFFRRSLTFPTLYVFCLLGYSTGGLLDACTSFGTQLFWPFSEQRIAWNLISIVDPIFSLVMLSFLIVSWRKQQVKFALYGLLFGLSYLLLSLFQQYNISQQQQALAFSRDHQIEVSVVKPTLGNIILWRSVYLFEGKYYVDAIRSPILGQASVFAGKSIDKLFLKEKLKTLVPQSQQVIDLQRFARLSQNFLVQHPDDAQVVGDIRYAMLPNSISPLWGIKFDTAKPNQHVSEQLFRQRDEKTRLAFWHMLMNRQSTN